MNCKFVDNLAAILVIASLEAPSPAPDLIPAKTKNPEDSHWDWYSRRGHFNVAKQPLPSSARSH